MKEIIIFMSIVGVIFILLHEFDACRRGEWKMFPILKTLKNEIASAIFQFAHIPILLFLIYYLWTVINFSNNILWIGVNTFLVIHFFLHIKAKKWQSNVFVNNSSFIFIIGSAITSVVNLLLISYY
jgi:hypothetical protein